MKKGTPVACGEHCMRQAARIRGLEVGTMTVGTAYSVYYGLLAEIIGEFRQSFL